MKNKLMKIVSILIVSVMVVLYSTSVFAADNNSFDDITDVLTKNNTSNNASNNTNTNSNTNTNTNTNVNTNTNLNTNTKNNSSVYNNTDLPKTGIEDSIPIAMLVVVFGISAVYAYKKINEYDNI